MTWRVLTPPAVEPITLEEARMHLRVTADGSPPSHPEDALISGLISAARDYCEGYLARAVARQTIEVVLDAFPTNEIQLPMSPIHSISELLYIDEDGVQQTLSPALYVLDNEQEPGWVLPLIDTTWPATMDVINAVRVRYEAGYTLVSDSPNSRPLPPAIRAAMLLLIGHWYENREAVNLGNIVTTLMFAVDALLTPYKLRLSMS